MKGKIALERAEKVAKRIIDSLSPHCQKIEVAGSIRRRRPWVNDIDIVLVPNNDLWSFHNEVMKLGKVKISGSKILRIEYGDIQVDFYIATPETWATLLLIRTGSAENNIRLAKIAKEKGWRLHASGEGLFNELGDRIAGNTEESIYQALSLPYQKPVDREV